jgi:hypothetical protein
LKKQYQIEKERAVQQFRRMATENNTAVRLGLPIADIAGMVQEGVGNLVRETGLMLMQLVMQEEVRQLAGEGNQQHEGRKASRWGTEAGFCAIDGEKVPIQPTRLRATTEDGRYREHPLGS